ncbi:MAG: tyrosine-protein kinase domain-containing protein [Anaerolineae bacterium]
MALEDYLRVARKWWWLLLLSTLVAAASSYVSVSRTPRIYQATTTVVVGQSLNAANPTYSDFSIAQQLAQTYVNMVTRTPILQGAAEALGLSYLPWSGNITAQMVAGTQLIAISVRDTSPELAQALADEIAHQLILQTPGATGDQERQAFVQAQLQRLEENIAITEAEIEAEQLRLDAANSARAIAQYESNIAALQQKLSSYQSTHASYLQSSSGGTNYISIVEPAPLPDKPISPNVPATVALGAAIGLALAAGGALLIEFLDNTIKTTEDVTRTTHLSTLGTISSIAGERYEDKLATAYVPHSPVAESFRALRTNIQYCAVNKQLRALLLTSSAPAEGKSIILANLAVVMAQSGLRVLLVDADLRRPVQHRLFGLRNHFGLSDALLEPGTDIARFCHVLGPEALADRLSDGEEPRTTRPPLVLGEGSLRVMTAGTVPPNPADLLGSERMKALVTQLEAAADIVLFDTPPVLAVTDAVTLAGAVDGVLLVAEVGHSKRAALKQAAERLSQVDANLLGVILNRASQEDSGYYSYRYYAREDEEVTAGGRRNGSSPPRTTPSRTTAPRTTPPQTAAGQMAPAASTTAPAAAPRRKPPWAKTSQVTEPEVVTAAGVTQEPVAPMPADVTRAPRTRRSRAKKNSEDTGHDWEVVPSKSRSRVREQVR